MLSIFDQEGAAIVSPVPAPDPVQTTPKGAVPLPGFGNLAELRTVVQKKRKEIDARFEGDSASVVEEEKDEGLQEESPSPADTAPAPAPIQILPPAGPIPPAPAHPSTEDENSNTDDGIAKGVIEVGASKAEVEAHEELKPVLADIVSKRASLNVVLVKAKEDPTTASGDAEQKAEAGPMSILAQLNDKFKTRPTAMDAINIDERLAADKDKAKAAEQDRVALVSWLGQGKKRPSITAAAPATAIATASSTPATAAAVQDDDLKKWMERRKMKNGELPMPGQPGAGEQGDGSGMKSDSGSKQLDTPNKPPPSIMLKKKKPKPPKKKHGIDTEPAEAAGTDNKGVDRNPSPSPPPPPPPESDPAEFQSRTHTVTDSDEFAAFPPPPDFILDKSSVQDGEEGRVQEPAQQVNNADLPTENGTSSFGLSSPATPAIASSQQLDSNENSGPASTPEAATALPSTPAIPPENDIKGNGPEDSDSVEAAPPEEVKSDEPAPESPSVATPAVASAVPTPPPPPPEVLAPAAAAVVVPLPPPPPPPPAVLAPGDVHASSSSATQCNASSPTSTAAPSPSNGMPSDLLASIRAGTTLRSVLGTLNGQEGSRQQAASGSCNGSLSAAATATRMSPESSSGSLSMQEALLRVLARRHAARRLQSSDEEDDSGDEKDGQDDDDDEWN